MPFEQAETYKKNSDDIYAMYFKDGEYKKTLDTREQFEEHRVALERVGAWKPDKRRAEWRDR